MQDVRKKPEGLVTKHLEILLSEGFFSLQRENHKTPATSETDLSVTLTNG